MGVDGTNGPAGEAEPSPVAVDCGAATAGSGEAPAPRAGAGHPAPGHHPEPGHPAPGHTEVFTTHRPLLFSLAYEILGSVGDAEDVLQESYLRWSRVDLTGVAHPRAYLARIVTRQALGELRSAARRREEYVGPWLPEPLATGGVPGGPDGIDHVLTGEAVTTAMLLVLETLTPAQRAVFVMREVFAFGYGEIAAAVGKSEAAVRQLNHRAREQVHSQRRTAVASPAQAEEVSQRFSMAAATGDVQGLMDVLAPTVVFIADGGGLVNAARRPVLGPDKVARMVIGLMVKGQRMGEVDFRFGLYNGMHSVVVSLDGVIDQVTSIEVTEGVVSAVYCVRNPGKLSKVRFD